MPGKVKVRVLAGRQLPVMDRSSDTTDAFAEVKLGDTTFKTDVCRKSLNPRWNSEWFRFDVDDLDLQDEPLQIRIMDYDTYSANDAIGKVYVDLNPLLIAGTERRGGGGGRQHAGGDEAVGGGGGSSGVGGGGGLGGSRHGQGSMMSGWLPVFDTMHGVRGEVNVQVKVELFSDHNKFRQSSCGVPFFFTCGVPEGYRAQFINGFVEELVVNDDPEYQWIDKIRTPRASNEARQTLFMKLCGAVQRKIGLKALELGGNAVIGYQQRFDLEGDTGIVVRGIGTAVTLIKIASEPQHKDLTPAAVNGNSSHHHTVGTKNGGSSAPETSSATAAAAATAANANAAPLSEAVTILGKSPDSDTGHSPKEFAGGGVAGSSASAVAAGDKPTVLPKTFAKLEGQHDTLEYPFITIKKFPPGLVQRYGGLVSCRSVKLLDEGEEEEEIRDSWWTEIRREIRSHAKALGCNLIVGYTEDTVISEDVVVLCAAGTAAQGNLSYMLDLESVGIYGPPFIPNSGGGGASGSDAASSSSAPKQRRPSSPPPCHLVHLPYNDINLPFSFRTSKCRNCLKGRVPDVMFTTVEPPTGLDLAGRGCLLQAKVLRPKKDLKAENNAKEISDKLPFIEYEVHRQLINKLKVKGMNGLFGLTTKLSVSDRTIIATATATAAYISALPQPSRPRLAMTSSLEHDQQRLLLMQQRLDEKVTENIKYYELNNPVLAPPSSSSAAADKPVDPNHEDMDAIDSNECLEADLATGNKETCVLEIDDTEDADIVDSLMDQFPPSSIQVYSTEDLIGLAPQHIVNCCQTFSQIWRGRIQPTSRDLSKACKKLLSSVYFKLRRLRPCVICKLDFKADFNEENELQLSLYGTAISFAHNGKTKGQLEPPGKLMAGSSIQRPLKGTNFFVEMAQNHAIVLTPLSYVPGAKIDKYLGNLNFFLIRETSSLREVGGLSSFVQWFICEIYSIVRSHVSALAGNAIVSYFMSEFVVTHSAHKNQAQCLIHVGGDAVKVTYIPYSPS